MEAPLRFEDLYRRHSADVFRFAYWLCGSRAEADDLTAEAFARVWAGGPDLQVQTVRGYLFAIVRNLHVSAHRKQRELAMPEDLVFADPAPGPEEQAIHEDALAFTLDELDRLPSTDRAALLMRAEGGLPYEEIAAALGITVVNAKVKVHRARQRLLALHTA